MSEVKDLAPNFRHVRLLLARAQGHPRGERSEGYDLLVPLDKDGRLDADTWRKHKSACRVRRFTEEGDARIGRLRRKPADNGISITKRAKATTRSDSASEKSVS